jgi:protein DGCR14
MFTPDADVSPYHPPATDENSKNLKKVDYAKTRLKEQEHDVGDKPLSAPPSPTRSRVDAAIAGNSMSFGNDLIVLYLKLPSQGYTPSGSQLVLVPDLPSPTPAELGPTAMKQLMTWGTLNATPRIINQTGEAVVPSAAFRIPEMTSREAIGHKLSNKAVKSLRVKAEMFTPKFSKTGTLDQKLKGSMPPPSWTPRRSDAVGNLTPAARRLLERTAMGMAPSRSAGMESSSEGQTREKDLDRVRWTPTPSASRE